MTRISSGKENTEKKEKLVLLFPWTPTEPIEVHHLIGVYLRSENQRVISVEHSEHGEFKAFIEQYVNLEGEGLDEWDMFDRVDILTFLMQQDVKPELFKAYQ